MERKLKCVHTFGKNNVNYKKMTLEIYVDSCIFVAYYSISDRNNQHKQVIDCLEVIRKNKKIISLATSDFTFTEFVKVMQNKERLDEASIYKILSNITRQRKIGNKYPFRLVEAEGREEEYTFNDFFVGLQEILLLASPGLADTIHARIMMNNKINHILTFDVDDFSKIPNINPINPMEIDYFVRTIKN